MNTINAISAAISTNPRKFSDYDAAAALVHVPAVVSAARAAGFAGSDIRAANDYLTAGEGRAKIVAACGIDRVAARAVFDLIVDCNTIPSVLAA